MSAPVSSFSKLSLSSENERMISSRGQRRGPFGGKGKQPLPPDYSSSSSEEEDSDKDLDEDPDDGGEATGHEHILALYHCRQIGADDDRYLAFQIADAEVVRYGVRVRPANNGGLPQCSCNSNPDEICRHVRWLLDQLGHIGVTTPVGTTPDYYSQITALGLETICEEQHWEFRQGAESDEEETTWKLKKDYRGASRGLQTRRMMRERQREIRDILATLSNDVVQDYRKDIFESVDDISMEDTLVPHDLGATVYRLLVQDDDVFYQFKSLVPHNIRAMDFFRKMDIKAKSKLRMLDNYIQNGPSTAGRHDLIWCAQELVEIVDTISANVAARQPLTAESRKEAAKILVSILIEVVRNRNKDVYQDDRLPRRRQHGEPHTDRNLYQRLIGSTSPQNPAGNTFIITALQNLPEAQDFVEDLEELLSILETIGWGPAPIHYRQRLAVLIRQLKSRRVADQVARPPVRAPVIASASTTSPSKRPSMGGDRKVIKRMK